MASLGDIVVRIGADITDVSNKLGSLGSMFKAAFVFNVVDTGLDKLADMLTSVARAGIEFNSAMEQNKIAFETMTGSAEIASNVLNDLAIMAAKTPYTFQGLAESGKRLVAFGFDAEAIPYVMKNIGDAASGLGMSEAGIKGITMAFGDMIAAGKIYASDMRQLVSRGIPAWKILSEQMGKSVPEIMKMVRDGGMESTKAVELLIKGMGERFPNMMEKQSKTWQGLLSTIKDNIEQLSGALSSGLFEKMKGIFEKIVDFTSKFMQIIKQTKSPLEGIRWSINEAFGGGALIVFNAFIRIVGTVYNAIKTAVGFIINAWNSLSGAAKTAITAAGTVIAGLGVIFSILTPIIIGVISAIMAISWPILLVVVSIGFLIVTIGLLVGAFIYLWNTNQEFRDFMIQTWTEIGIHIQSVCEQLWPIIQATINGIAVVFSVVFPICLDIVKNFFIGLSKYIQTTIDLFDGFLQILSGVFTNNWGMVWDGCRQIFGDTFDSIVITGVDAMNALIDMVYSALSTIIGAENDVLRFFNMPTMDIPQINHVSLPYSVKDTGSGFSGMFDFIGDSINNSVNKKGLGGALDDIMNSVSNLPSLGDVLEVDTFKPDKLFNDAMSGYEGVGDAAKGSAKKQQDALDDVTKALEEFVDGVQSQADKLMDFGNMWDKIVTEKFSGTKLLRALQSQVEVMSQWRDNLTSLGKRIGFDSELYRTLLSLGPQAAGQIKGLNLSDDSIIQKYISEFGKKSDIAYDMGYVMQASEQATEAKNQQIAINVTGNTISGDYEVDRIADRIIQKLRLQGVY